MRAEEYITSHEALAAIAKQVRDMRLLRNWTQRELADRAGVGYSTLRRLEDGASVRLADTLQVLEVLGLLGPLVNSVQEVVDEARRHVLVHKPAAVERKRAYRRRSERKNV